MEPMSPQMHEYVNHIEMSVNKLDLFIGEILDYSRNERLPLSIEVIDVRALTEEILENLKFSPRFDEIRVDSSGLSEQPVATDRMRLKIVLTNLLSNAIKFQRFDPLEPAHIRIRSTADEKGYTLVVEDNGEGIKYEHQLRIFDMFFRASTTSKGSGLGLYIVKEVMERLGGEVAVHSERGKGSSFSIRIPAPK
jgi:signal transduction histidine kinase